MLCPTATVPVFPQWDEPLEMASNPTRNGCRAWVFGTQSYRQFGTAAEWTVVPAQLAVDLPDEVPDQVRRACLGISGITAHRAVFGDGPVSGLTVLVGVLGGVNGPSLPSSPGGLAPRPSSGRCGDRKTSPPPTEEFGADHVVALDAADPAGQIRAVTPEGVDRIVEVGFSDNVDLDASITKVGTIIAAYASREGRPSGSRSGRCCSTT